MTKNKEMGNVPNATYTIYFKNLFYNILIYSNLTYPEIIVYDLIAVKLAVNWPL